MTVGSLFSGIGLFDLAAERVWDPGTVRWQVEIGPFARRILTKHWPDVKRYEDIRTTDPAGLEPVDLVCGGWPCQGNSVAGQRQGHADARSGLFREILRLVDGMAPRPRFLLLENVPGLVSVNHGRDFRDVVTELRGRGYVGCVRRLDSQHFGLAQRRSRLFFVAGLGVAGTRAVQFVLESGVRYPAPGRAAREDVAGPLGGVSPGGGWRGDLDTSGAYVSQPLLAKSNSSHDDSKETYVSATLTGEGHDASEDGTGHGAPLVAYQCQGTNVGEMGVLRQGNGNVTGGVPFVTAFSCKDSGQDAGEVALTLRAMEFDASRANDGGQVAVLIPKPGVTAPDDMVSQSLTGGDTDGEKVQPSEAGPGELLRSVQGADATKTSAERGSRISVPLQASEVLRSELYGVGFQGEISGRSATSRGEIPGADSLSNAEVREVRFDPQRGSTPPGREPAQQRPGEHRESMPEVPLLDAQPDSALFREGMREEAAPKRLLRDARPAGEEDGRPVEDVDAKTEAVLRGGMFGIGECEGSLRSALYAGEAIEHASRTTVDRQERSMGVSAVRRLTPT